MFHVALFDAGYRRHGPSCTPASQRYFHLTRPLAATIDRVGIPTLPVAVTVMDEGTRRAVGMADTPAMLRALLRRLPE